MKVKDLRKELESAPDDALVFIGVDNGNYIEMSEPDIEATGYCEIGEPCDKEGNPVDDGVTDLWVFCIMPKGLCTVEQPENTL